VNEEHQALQESKSQVESEKSEVQRQLENREQEVQSLVKRCKSQEDQVKDATLLRASHQQLEGRIAGLQSTLAMREGEISRVETLQKELKQSQEARHDLEARLAKMKKDHDDVVDTLNSCFQNIQKLQDKQQEHEEDRRRENQRAQLALEQQRLTNLETVQQLQVNLARGQDRIVSLEALLNDAMDTTASLRKEKAQLAASLAQSKLDQQEKGDRLEAQHQQAMQQVQADNQKQLQELQSVLHERDCMIATLEVEVSTGMTKLMKLSEELDQNRLDSSMLELDTANRVQELEQENWSLQEQFATKDLEISVLAASLALVEDEKASMVKEMEKLHGRIQELEHENAFIMDLEQQLEDVNVSVLEAQQDTTRIQETYEEEMVTIRKDFEEKQTLWYQTEQRLLEKIRALQEEMDTTGTLLSSQFEAAKCQVSSLEKELAGSQEASAALQSSHELLREEVRSQDSLITDIRAQLAKASQTIASKETTIVSLTTKLQQAHVTAEDASAIREKQVLEVALLKQQLEEIRISSSEHKTDLQRMKLELEQTQESYRKELSSLKGQLQGKENMVSNLTEKLNDERRSKINMAKAMREEGDTAKQAWRHELMQANVLLQQKRKEVESLQLDLVNMSGRGEKELNAAHKAMNEQSDKMDLLQQELLQARDELTQERSCVQSLRFQLSDSQAEISNAKELATAFQSQVLEKENMLLSCLNDLSLLKEEILSKDTAITAKEDTISSLLQDLARFRTATEEQSKSLDEVRAELRFAHENAGGEISAARKKISDQEKTVSSLQSELHSTNLEVHRLEAKLTSLAAEMEAALVKYEQESKSWLAKLEEKEAALECKEAELQSMKSTLEDGTSSLSAEIKAQTAKACSLNKKLAAVEFEMEERDRKNRVQLAEKNVELSRLKHEIETLRNSKSLSEDQLKTLLNEKDNTIEGLSKRIEDLIREQEEQGRLSQTEMVLLKQKLQKTEIDLAISQDELRDLKLIDLKECEETIQSLEATVLSLRTKIRNDETSSNSLIANLRTRISELQGKLSVVERGQTDAKHLHDKTTSKLQTDLEAMKQENDSLNREVKENFDKAKECQLTITKLSSEKVELEGSVRSLRSELDLLKADYKKVKEEQENTAFLLEQEIEKHWANRHDDDVEFQKRQSSLKKALQESEAKIASLTKENEEVEQILDQRMGLLAEMVAHNKELEEMKEAARKELGETKDELDECKSKLETTQRELSQLRSTFTKKEDQLLDTIQTERELREVAEVELENLHAKLNTKRDDKELTELEKANIALRDKVRRQEAYLKRKLQKDKALRDRNVKGPSSAISAATPSRVETSLVGPPFSSSRGNCSAAPSLLVRKPSGIPSMTSRKPTKLMTPTGSENLFPEELSFAD
jgi:chromosome segregation ATPase